MPNFFLGGVNDQGNSPRAFWFSKGDLDLIWPLVRSGFGVLALFFHFDAGVKSVDHFGAGLSCHQSPHRKLRTTTAKIRSVCIPVIRKNRRDCHRRRFQFSFAKHLSVASHFEVGQTNKAPCEISRRMPRQCQGKFLS